MTNCFILTNFMAGTCQEYSFPFLPVVGREVQITENTERFP